MKEYCEYCHCRGDLSKCEQQECNVIESWIFDELRNRVELYKIKANNYKEMAMKYEETVAEQPEFDKETGMCYRCGRIVYDVEGDIRLLGRHARECEKYLADIAFIKKGSRI